ncbi:MAG TPA: AsmA family protein [Candidatus Acidoferrales bacterium]
MPDLLSEPAVQDLPPPEPAPVPRPRSWSWLPKTVAAILIFFWIASAGISLLITHTRLQRRITGRLQNVFGRPVEVGRYDFSLWGGPTLEAESVTFAEDPRFGHEYFLRAESVTVRLRWQSLLRGHMELGTVSLTRPSLNLVRNAAGDWNLAEWLPRPSSSRFRPSVSGPSPVQPQPSVRFTRLEVDSGRINFKRGDEKIPFALTTVNGYVEPEGPGRWRVNLEASPARAALALQTPGTLYLSGSLGGTSSRLRPAALDLAWGDASISDLLRLFRGDDFGVRGNFAVVAHAETQGDVWNLQARSQLRELHRWDLPLHAENPALDVNARMILSPLVSSLAITDATIEGPASSARVTANFDWTDAAESTRGAAENPNHIEVTESQISLQDALTWLRGFHPDVAPDAVVSGTANSSASLTGWPPRLVAASALIKSAELTSPRLRLPARLSQFHLRYDQGRFTLPPAALTFGPPDAESGVLHFDSSSANHEAPAFHVSGNVPQARNLIAAASVLGWNISRGWDLSGPVRCDLRWPAGTLPWKAQPAGTIEWGTESANATLLTPFLNQPVLQIRARADLKFDSRHITVAGANAFGAHWTGAFDHRDGGPGWQFAVVADQLTAADLDRWLNPRWRESFIYRVLPFLNPNSPTNSLPEDFRASGRLSVDEFTLAPLVLRHLHGDMTVGGRHLEITNAKAQLFGGNVDGSLDAELTATPAYRVVAEYSGIDLAALTATSPSLANLFAGSVSGDLALDFSGATQSKMVSSLECSGTARFVSPEIHGLNLPDMLHDAALRSGSTAFHDGEAAFTCADAKIVFHDLSFSGAPGIQGAGAVNFDRTIDLRLWPATNPVPASAAAKSSAVPARDAIELTGPLARPSVRRSDRSAPQP